MDELVAKYNTHKNSAMQRGIGFDLSFDEWKAIWDGNFHRRGRGSSQLGMLRTRDEGSYTIGNVRLGTPKENRQEAATAHMVNSVQKWTRSADYFVKPPMITSWVAKRGYVFDEYTEDEEEFC